MTPLPLLPAALALSLLGGSGPPPSAPPVSGLAAEVRSSALPLSDDPRTLDPLIRRAREAKVVLIGEATHGTYEFYRTRAEITKRLISEAGFAAVVVEGDWPDAMRVNRFVRGQGMDQSPGQALTNFTRFPRWLWRNAVVRDFVGWLRGHNARRQGAEMAGFYGMDLYSLPTSRREVLRLSQALDPALAKRIGAQYACLDALGLEFLEDSGALPGQDPSCQEKVAGVFSEVRRLAAERSGMGDASRDLLFDLEQNARVVKNAVAYERASADPFGDSSWNVRDGHMFETVEAIRAELGPDTKIVVWAHNSHLGDARATEMGRGGELNVGQLIRQRYGPASLHIGFTTHAGTVTAAREWGGPAQQMQVRPSLEGSYENLFHQTGLAGFLLDLRGAPRGLGQDRLERAIGVQYLPASERMSHYFQTNLPRQFDMVLHIDVTRALEPLDPPGKEPR